MTFSISKVVSMVKNAGKSPAIKTGEGKIAGNTINPEILALKEKADLLRKTLKDLKDKQWPQDDNGNILTYMITGHSTYWHRNNNLQIGYTASLIRITDNPVEKQALEKDLDKKILNNMPELKDSKYLPIVHDELINNIVKDPKDHYITTLESLAEKYEGVDSSWAEKFEKNADLAKTEMGYMEPEPTLGHKLLMGS